VGPTFRGAELAVVGVEPAAGGVEWAAAWAERTVVWGEPAVAEVELASQVGDPPPDTRQRRQVDGLCDRIETQATHNPPPGADNYC
jgi:hypothetical protein